MKRFLFLALTALAVLVNVQARTWVLDDQHASFTAQDGDVIIGEYAMGEFYSISIANNAKVTFQGARIGFHDVSTTSVAPNVIPVNCLGNAEITISGEVHITTGREFPAIFIPQGKTLKIYGTDADSLYVHSGPKAAAIGAYNDVDAGSIQIYGGRIEAQGGRYAAAIGGAYLANCGGIDIYGGHVTAIGGEKAAGIGSGFDSSRAGYINISGAKVYAKGGFRAAGIGCGVQGTHGVLNISGSNTNVTAVKGDESLCSIGASFGGQNPNSGAITIGGVSYPDGVVRSYFNYPNIHDIDLSTMHNDFTVEDGDVLFGTLGNDRIRITVADNAKITLRNAVIPELLGKGSACGLECLGDAEITLEGNNEVWHRGGGDYPAIFYPENHTLNIKGNGKLVAHGGGSSAAIGTGACLVWKESIGGINVSNEDIITCLNKWAGNLNIYSGTIEAYGGVNGPGIGAARHAHCGEIQILGGKVSAYGGQNAPGIGAAGWTGAENPTVCGDIRISGGTVYARGKGTGIAIGAENVQRYAKCGNVRIANTVNKLTAIKGDNADKCINSTDGTVYVAGQAKANGIDLSPYYYPENKVINLANQHSDFTVMDGYTLTGTLTSRIKIQVEDGAEITLQDAVIARTGNTSDPWAGLTLLGNAEIRIEGNNTVEMFGADYPGIFVPANKSLVVKGDGNLNAKGGTNAAGIGAGNDTDAGHIILQSGTIRAEGGKYGAGIGGAYLANCGDIMVFNANVTAIAGENAAAIGSGYDSSAAGNIYLYGGTIVAEGNGYGAGIGAGGRSTCGQIQLRKNITYLKATKGANSLHSIGHAPGAASSSGNIYVDEKFYSAGISTSPFYFPNNNMVDLNNVTESITLMNGETVTGTLGSNVRLYIAPGATITLQDVTINGVDNNNYPWAGLTCLGSAKIILKGENYVSGFKGGYPAIYVPEEKTLTINGEGKLVARSHGNAACIGAGQTMRCGSISIQGGIINAIKEENDYGAGIGGGYDVGTYENIVISGGEVVAEGGKGSAGIGSGYGSKSCGLIAISGGTVYATGGDKAPGIGAGQWSAVSNITIKKSVTKVVSVAGLNSPFSVGTAARDGNKTSLLEGTVKVGDEVSDGRPEKTFIYFGESESATNAYVRTEAKVFKLDTIHEAMTFIHGDQIYGTLQDPVKLSIAQGATIYLNGAKINGVNADSYSWAGLNFIGDATIVLGGNENTAPNIIKGFHEDFPGIYVPQGKTLTIKAGNPEAGLTASSNGYGAGIGGGYEINCGNIVIESGKIYATGGTYAAAIGCGGNSASCGNITVAENGVYIEATKGSGAVCTIGKGSSTGAMGTIKIGTKTYADGVTVSPYVYPEAVTGNTLNLNNLTTDYTITQDTLIITGTLNRNVKITANKNNGVIVLRNATINGTNSTNYQWAGITCEQPTFIILEGENTVKGFYEYYPGIFNKSNLYIKGTGKLTVSSNGNAPAIGASRDERCGYINILSGHIVATGGRLCAAIGGTSGKNCGQINIYGGAVDATGGYLAPAIGAPDGTSCSGIRINPEVTYVKATKGSGASYSVSLGTNSSDMTIDLGGGYGIHTKNNIANQVFEYNPSKVMSYRLLDGDNVNNTLGLMYHFTVAQNATVSFNLVDINGINDPQYDFAAITCEGNNTLIFNGAGCYITGFYETHPAIEVLSGSLTIKNGCSDLRLKSNGKAPAIGTAPNGTCGNITLDINEYKGKLFAKGGWSCPAIGPGANGTCGNIYIKKGVVTVEGGDFAPAIGAGVLGQCGDIYLYPQASTTATGGQNAPYSVGKGYDLTYNTATSIVGQIKLLNTSGAVDQLINDGIEENPFYYPTSLGIAKHRAHDGEVFSGEVPYRLVVAPNATIYLDDATIGGQEGFEYYEPGIYCEGNATIVYSGNNSVQSFSKYFPGIFIPEGYRLTLRKGSEDALLEASSKGDIVQANMVRKEGARYVVAAGNPKMAAGIGGCYDVNTIRPMNCGDIVIESGHVIAYGGAGHPGIGGGEAGDCGNITILGGQVEAYGGTGCPGIGAGSGGSCGAVLMTRDVIRVESTAGENAPYSVGEAESSTTYGVTSTCELIMVGNTLYDGSITDRVFIYEPTEEEKHEAIDIVTTDDESGVKTYKVLHNGQILIIRGNQIFTITGQRVK